LSELFHGCSFTIFISSLLLIIFIVCFGDWIEENKYTYNNYLADYLDSAVLLVKITLGTAYIIFILVLISYLLCSMYNNIACLLHWDFIGTAYIIFILVLISYLLCSIYNNIACFLHWDFIGITGYYASPSVSGEMVNITMTEICADNYRYYVYINSIFLLKAGCYTIIWTVILVVVLIFVYYLCRGCRRHFQV
jgi:hypothetical protein